MYSLGFGPRSFKLRAINLLIISIFFIYMHAQVPKCLYIRTIDFSRVCSQRRIFYPSRPCPRPCQHHRQSEATVRLPRPVMSAQIYETVRAGTPLQPDRPYNIKLLNYFMYMYMYTTCMYMYVQYVLYSTCNAVIYKDFITVPSQ
jgi:hypothetical protein